MIFGWREYSHYSEKKGMSDSYNSIIDFNEAEKSELKSSLNLKAADNYIMRQNFISERIAKEQFKKELEGYKKVNAYMKSEIVTSIKSLESKYNEVSSNQFDDIEIMDGEYIHKDVVDKYFLRVPKTFNYADDWFSLTGTVKKESTIIDTLYMLNKFDAIIGYKKSEKKFSWLRKKSPVVELTSYNPYSKINYVNNIVVDKNKGKVGNILFSKPAMIIYGFLGASILN